MDFKINKLTSQEIKELQVDKALRIVEQNTNILADIEQALFDSIGELGKWKIKVEQLKSLKNTVIEQNRGLGVVIKNG